MSESPAEFLAKSQILSSMSKEAFVEQGHKFESDLAKENISGKSTSWPNKQSHLDDEIYSDCFD